MIDRDKESLRKPLPGERQGTSRVGAGRGSMRNTNGRMLRKRVPVLQEATTFYNIEEERDQVVNRIGNESSQEQPVVGHGSNNNKTAQKKTISGHLSNVNI